MCFKEKNGRISNEMNEPLMEHLKTSKNGFELTCVMRDAPVSFINGLRRVLLSEIPTVVLNNIQIIENTTQIPHEMLKHRIEMLPVRVRPDDAAAIRDGEVSLYVLPNKDQDGVQTVTTKNFNSHPRPDMIMTDRDIDEPLIFIRVRPNEGVSFKAGLKVAQGEGVSQVCTATTHWTIDEEMVKYKRKEFIETGQDVRIFDNSLQQRCYYRNETGRPNMFTINVESVGVLKSIELLNMAAKILQRKVETWTKFALDNINHESEPNVYSVVCDEGGHTIGALFQEVLCYTEGIKFASYDIPHPLKPSMVLRFLTTKSPKTAVQDATDEILSYCSVVEKATNK